MAVGKSGKEAGGPRGARRGRPEPAGARAAPGDGANRAREMVTVDPWGALLAGLLEPAEDGVEEPTEARPMPGRGDARQK
jgi:hypothetical protein